MRAPSVVEGALASPRLLAGAKQIVVAGPVSSDGGQPALPVHPQILKIRQTDPALYRRIQDDLARLLRQIATQGEVDARYYRASRNRGDALLLGSLRVMHLHLLHPGSDVLLYLIQTKAAVVLLELGPHHHLAHVPPGKSFNLEHIRRAARRL